MYQCKQYTFYGVGIQFLLRSARGHLWEEKMACPNQVHSVAKLSHIMLLLFCSCLISLKMEIMPSVRMLMWLCGKIIELTTMSSL